jgi:hypothetical protein
LIPVDEGKRYLGKTMLSRIAALLLLSSHVRVLASAVRPKESSFLQRLRFNGDGTTFNPFGTMNVGARLSSTSPER